MTHTGSAIVRHLATWQLPGGPSEPIGVDDEVLSRSDIARLLDNHQLTGIALAAIDGGALTGDVAVLVDEVRSRHLDQLRRAVAVEADLVSAFRQLAGAGVDARVVKGGATAHLDHTDPAQRLTTDVDVLVRPDELAAATAAVRTIIDATASVPDRRQSWTERYGKDRTLALASGCWLDLHRMPAPGYHGLVDRFDWFAEPASFVLGGTTLQAPPLGARFVHALAHAGYGDEVRLHSLRDVPLLLAELGEAWRSAVEAHPEWTGLLRRGVRTVWRDLGLATHPLLEWAERVDVSWRERTALRAFDLPGSRQHWSSVLAVGPHRWPGLLGPLVIPSRAYLAHYDRAAGYRITATLRQVARGRRG